MKFFKILIIITAILIIGYIITKNSIPSHLSNLTSDEHACAIAVGYINTDNPIQKLLGVRYVVNRTIVEPNGTKRVTIKVHTLFAIPVGQNTFPLDNQECNDLKLKSAI